LPLGNSRMPDFNKNFIQTLAALNPQQRAAVEHIDGPTLVIAGPGTGKTHILAARIGQILTVTDTQPHNILCLTFTDAAVQAMRERLTSLIGPEAHKVHISTFHSFCNRVIQDNLDLFGRQDLTQLDELERRQIIRQLLDELPHEHALKRGRGSDIYFYEKHLADIFKLMKTEAWTPQYISQKTDEWLEELPQNTDFQYKVTKKGLFTKGDLKTDNIAEEVEKMEKLKAAAQLYYRFEALKSAANRYDFDDMVLWVIDAFDRFPFLLRGYQEQFLYFLVDEFQDTNGSQNRILNQLIGFWEQPNVFIVGDDDQAIYEFQGARLKSLVDFYETYKSDVKVVVLTDNYRSSQNILDSARNTIENNALRIVKNIQGLKLEKKLTAKGSAAQSKAIPKIIEYPNRAQEVIDITEQIKALTQPNIALPTVSAESITTAILYARHRQIEPFIALFEKQDVPYTVRRALNVLDAPLIQNLRLLLEYVALESRQPFSGEFLLFKILNIRFLDIQQQDVLKLTTYLAKKNPQTSERATPSHQLTDGNAATSGGGETSPTFSEPSRTLTWRETIAQLPRIKFLDKTKITAFSTHLETWIAAVGNDPLPILVERLLNQSGLLSWILNTENKTDYAQIIYTFFDFIKNETAKRPRLTLADFLKTLDLMDANNIRLEFIKNTVAKDGSNPVVLTTAHSAKGLEFDHVFVIDAVKTEWEETRSGNIYRFKLPESLTFTAEEDATEARRRLFYVAATRAKEHLTVSYARTEARGKGLMHSQFLDELALNAVEKRQLDATTVLDNQIALLTEGAQIETDLVEKAFITTILKDFQLSISALNAYLDCPLSFYFTYILKVPSQPSAYFQYGEAVHFALRKLFGEMLRSKDKQFPSDEEFVNYFEMDLHRRRPFFEVQDFNRRLATGQSNLTKYYHQFAHKFEKNVVIEKTVIGQIGGVPVRGILDKIEFKTDGSVHIVDYKTGKLSDEKLRRPSARNPLGGDYWRQLVFYKLLYENFRANLIRVTSGEISYVEADARGHFKTKIFDFGAQDSEILRGLISESWARIQAHDFTGCGKKTCTWCNFVKNNKPMTSFRNDRTEGLDD
jgi:DNA helicase II / ATP-dependent DNA helicase PcrA